MSETRVKEDEELAALRKEFDRLITEGPPRVKPPEPPPAPDAEVVPFNPWGPRRPWRAEPLAASNALPYEPTALDRQIEMQRANAQAARLDRLRRDPFGLAIYGGHETIDDVVRRQNGD